MAVDRRRQGAHYEALAAAFLTEKGLRLLDKNYNSPYGELDLVLEEGETLVFCEVKARRSFRYGDPLEAVTARKRQRICKTALHYLWQKPQYQGRACRFDVVAIYPDGRLEHLENAFPFEGSLFPT